jgi:hypothetical protein
LEIPLLLMSALAQVVQLTQASSTYISVDILRRTQYTARNHSCVITIFGYHGNPVYQVVALIPVWVTVI